MQSFFYSVAHTRHTARWFFEKKNLGLIRRAVWRKQKMLPLRMKIRDDREWLKFTRGKKV